MKYSKPNHHGHLVYGVGICDAPTRIGREPQFKDYQVWKSMVRRTKGVMALARNPTYEGCSVDPVWLKYSGFSKFHAKHYVDGYQLDKDILVPGNKIYGPKYCRYVPQAINSLFTDHGRARGKYPLGITTIRRGGKLCLWVQLNVFGNRKYLGTFELDDLDSAVACYRKAKAEQIIAVAKKWKDKIDRDVYRALLRRAKNGEF